MKLITTEAFTQQVDAFETLVDNNYNTFCVTLVDYTPEVKETVTRSYEGHNGVIYIDCETIVIDEGNSLVFDIVLSNPLPNDVTLNLNISDTTYIDLTASQVDELDAADTVVNTTPVTTAQTSLALTAGNTRLRVTMMAHDDTLIPTDKNGYMNFQVSLSHIVGAMTLNDNPVTEVYVKIPHQLILL